MFEVSVSGSFAATHQLGRTDGTLEPLHEHHWRVSATFAGRELNEQGVLVDFAWLKRSLDEVLATLHERNLNELDAFTRRAPSAENVAVHVAERFSAIVTEAARLRVVEVEEAPGCIARFIRERS